MADPIDRYAKLVDAQVKMLDAIGRFNKAQADAELQWAMALAEGLRNAARERILHQMDLATHNLNQERLRLKLKKLALDDDQRAYRILLTAFKPNAIASFFNAFRALDRLISELGSSEVLKFYATPAAAAQRTAANFVPLVAGATATDAPTDVDNVGALIDWMKSSICTFKKAKPAHLLFLKALDGLDAAIEKRETALDKAAEDATDGGMNEIEALAGALGLPAAIVKSPVKPA